MDHFRTYSSIVRLAQNQSTHLCTLCTFRHMFLTKPVSMLFLHLLLTFGLIHLISTRPQLEVVRWHLDEKERNTLTQFQSLKKSISCALIGKEAIRKLPTKLSMQLQLGQFKFLKTTSLSPQAIEGIREQD